MSPTFFWALLSWAIPLGFAATVLKLANYFWLVLPLWVAMAATLEWCRRPSWIISNEGLRTHVPGKDGAEISWSSVKAFERSADRINWHLRSDTGQLTIPVTRTSQVLLQEIARRIPPEAISREPRPISNIKVQSVKSRFRDRRKKGQLTLLTLITLFPFAMVGSPLIVAGEEGLVRILAAALAWGGISFYRPIWSRIVGEIKVDSAGIHAQLGRDRTIMLWRDVVLIEERSLYEDPDGERVLWITGRTGHVRVEAPDQEYALVRLAILQFAPAETPLVGFHR